MILRTAFFYLRAVIYNSVYYNLFIYLFNSPKIHYTDKKRKYLQKWG